MGTLFNVCFIITSVLAVLTGAVCLPNCLLARRQIGRQQQQQAHRPREYIVDYHRNIYFKDFTDDEEELNRITRRTFLGRAGTHNTSARK